MSPFWTKEYLINLMRCQDCSLQRDEKDGFIYVVHVIDDFMPINQELAKQVIRMPGIVQERWREGWVETRDIGKVRWKHI